MAVLFSGEAVMLDNDGLPYYCMLMTRNDQELEERPPHQHILLKREYYCVKWWVKKTSHANTNLFVQRKRVHVGVAAHERRRRRE